MPQTAGAKLLVIYIFVLIFLIISLETCAIETRILHLPELCVIDPYDLSFIITTNLPFCFFYPFFFILISTPTYKILAPP